MTGVGWGRGEELLEGEGGDRGHCTDKMFVYVIFFPLLFDFDSFRTTYQIIRCS